MNDNDFMTQFREHPRKEFSETLYDKINKNKKKVTFWNIRERPLAFSLITVVIVFLISFAIIPSVRAATLQILKEIAGFNFLEMENPFEKPVGEDGNTYSFTVGGVVDEKDIGDEIEGLVIGDSGGTYSAPQISREELEENFQVRITNPVLPQGYETEGSKFYLVPNSQTSGEDDWLGMQIWFRTDTENALFLIMHPESTNLITVIGQNSVEEVLVNNNPAALLKGGWTGDPKSAEAEWDSENGNTLTWSSNGVTYELSSPDLDANSLIQIAETMD